MDMRDFTKSMLTLPWALSMFGVQQAARMMSSGEGDGMRDAARAFDEVTAATTHTFEGWTRQTYDFGTRVEDPYRWLENDVRVDPAVRQWVDDQNRVSRQLLDALPGRDTIKDALTRVWNQERQTVPVRRGGRLFFRREAILAAAAGCHRGPGPGGG